MLVFARSLVFVSVRSWLDNPFTCMSSPRYVKARIGSSLSNSERERERERDHRSRSSSFQSFSAVVNISILVKSKLNFSSQTHPQDSHHLYSLYSPKTHLSSVQRPPSYPHHYSASSPDPAPAQNCPAEENTTLPAHRLGACTPDSAYRAAAADSDCAAAERWRPVLLRA